MRDSPVVPSRIRRNKRVKDHVRNTIFHVGPPRSAFEGIFEPTLKQSAIARDTALAEGKKGKAADVGGEQDEGEQEGYIEGEEAGAESEEHDLDDNDDSPTKKAKPSKK